MDQGNVRHLYTAMVQTQLTPLLRANGFKRSHNTFRRFGPNGDASIVEFQRSAGSWQDEYLFYINLAAATGNWLKYMASRGHDKATTTPSAALGQWWTRLPSVSPHSDDIHTWRIRNDQRASECGKALSLTIETVVLPVFETWISFFDAVEHAVLAGSGAQNLLGEPPQTHPRGNLHFRDPSSPYAAWLRRTRP